MRRQGISGEVTVGFIVDAEGVPRELYVVKSSNKAFEPSALNSVSKWRFRPGMVNEKPVYTRMQVPLVFNINDVN
jgi:protein TonB